MTKQQILQSMQDIIAKHNLSLTKVATMTKMSRQGVKKFMDGKCNPSAATLDKYITFINTAENEIRAEKVPERTVTGFVEELITNKVFLSSIETSLSLINISRQSTLSDKSGSELTRLLNKNITAIADVVAELLIKE